MQLQDALGQFQVQLRADGRSEHTRNQYQRHVAALIVWLTAAKRTTKIEAITPAVVAEFFASDTASTSARGGKKKATSANAQRTSLRCFFRWAHESGLTATNAARLLKRARCAAPLPKTLHVDELARLATALEGARSPEDERDRVLITLLLNAGIRIGSAVGIDIEDIDFEHSELHLRTAKNDARATAVLPKAAAEPLRGLIGNRKTGPVFMAGDRRMSLRHAQRRIARWFEAANIRGKSCHTLRHCFATQLLERTGDLRLVQKAMGHRSIVSTTIYAQVDNARLRAAVGV